MYHEILKNCVVENYEKVNLAYKEQLDIVVMGDLLFKMTNGSLRKIQKIRLVPRLMHNLILFGQLYNKRHNMFIMDDA